MPYLLVKHPAMAEQLQRTLPLREETMACLADSAAGLVFDPAEHRYFLGKRELRSVSSIVEHFAPFDAEKVAERCSKNPKHPLFGKSVEEIIALWNETGRQAADNGTGIHAFGEACFLYMTGREDEIEEPFRERITPGGLLAVEPKEMAAAKWWGETDWRRFVPVSKETRVVNPILGYAGTFDLLLYDTYNFGFKLKDYKTNKDLYRWFGEMLLAPLAMIKSNDIGKYTVQQTLYTIQLRNCRLPVISNDLIWLQEETYTEVPLNMQYEKVVKYAVQSIFNES